MVEFGCEIKFRKQKDFNSILDFLNEYYETLDDESLVREILDNSNIWEDDFDEKIIYVETFETSIDIENGFEELIKAIIEKDSSIIFTAEAIKEFADTGCGKEYLYKYGKGELVKTVKELEGYFAKYINFIKKELTYTRFCKLFAIEKENFTEELYNELIKDISDKGLLKTKYETFKNFCNACTLDKDNYRKTIVKLKDSCLISFEEYMSDYCGCDEEDYDEYEE